MKANIKGILRKLSIVQKFSVAVISLIFIIMVVVNTLIITHQRSALRTEMDNNHLVVVRNLAKDAVEPLIFKDPLRLDEIVRITAQAPGCMYVNIVDRNERIVANTNRKLLGQFLDGDIHKYTDFVINRGKEYVR
jgi:sensor histidine kinase regulating citrate/malate metabolism